MYMHICIYIYFWISCLRICFTHQPRVNVPFVTSHSNYHIYYQYIPIEMHSTVVQLRFLLPILVPMPCVSISRRETFLQTFLALLDGGWWTGHLHGQAVGTTEGVAVSDDEGAGLAVLQQVDGWMEEEEKETKRGRKTEGLVSGGG